LSENQHLHARFIERTTTEEHQLIIENLNRELVHRESEEKRTKTKLKEISVELKGLYDKNSGLEREISERRT
jgi:hypothetical protein